MLLIAAMVIFFFTTLAEAGWKFTPKQNGHENDQKVVKEKDNASGSAGPWKLNKKPEQIEREKKEAARDRLNKANENKIWGGVKDSFFHISGLPSKWSTWIKIFFIGCGIVVILGTIAWFWQKFMKKIEPEKRKKWSKMALSVPVSVIFTAAGLVTAIFIMKWIIVTLFGHM